MKRKLTRDSFESLKNQFYVLTEEEQRAVRGSGYFDDYGIGYYDSSGNYYWARTKEDTGGVTALMVIPGIQPREAEVIFIIMIL